MGNQKPHIEKDRQYYDQKKIYKRTNNTITKRKYTKGQTKILKTLHRKLKIEQEEPH